MIPPLCDCGHARSQHDTDDSGAPWFCMAEVPLGKGFYDGNICKCSEYDATEPLTCAVCHDTIPMMNATLDRREGNVVALCPRHSDAPVPTSNGPIGPESPSG